MTIVNHIPVSQPGLYLCERVGRGHQKIRSITCRASEAQRLERRGATIWVARAGGWVRRD